MKKITFKKLSITNFLSFGKEIIIPLDKSGISIITGYNLDKGDGNGVGKSAIVDAFFFALFGETLKDLKKEEIVNNLAKKNCKVVLDFDIDKNGTITAYRIERGLSPSFCKIFVNGNEEKTLSTIPVTDKYILNLINSTPTAFRNTLTMCINNTIPFMSQKRNEKRAFIEGILRLELFKIMGKIAKENYDTLFKEYEFTIKNYEENNRNIQIYLESKDKFEKNRTEKLAELVQRKTQFLKNIENFTKCMVFVDTKEYQKLVSEIEQLTKQVELVEREYNIISGAITALESTKKLNLSKINTLAIKAKTLKEEYDKFPKYDGNIKTVEDCQTFIIKTREEIDKHKTDIVEHNRDIRDLETKINNIREMGTFCDKCKRPFPDNDIKKNETEIKAARELISKHTFEVANLLTIIENKKQMISKAEIISQIMSLNNERKTIIAENESIENTLLKNKEQFVQKQEKSKEIKELLKNAQTKKDTIQAQINKNTITENLIKNDKTNLQYCEEDIIKLEKEKNQFIDLILISEKKKIEFETQIANYKEKVAIYDVIKFVVSDEGAKSSIIKKLLGVLNERIAYYLNKMDANCQMTFDEYFEDKIINDKKVECSYHNFSGGERKRIDLACLFAFMDLRRIQGDVSFNLAFYDELLDSALSINGSEKVFDILKERTDKYNEASFVVTHKKENLKNQLISDIIYLEKSGGITKLGVYTK
jgi:DNA repair exonuclease SbcCD ATPase subunit